MIYLITGVPGSGKSLYAVSTLIRDLLKQKVTLDDGSQLDRRLVVDGIPNLSIPHELMAPMKQGRAIMQGSGKAKEPPKEWEFDGDALATWTDWCKPGDLIVVDEVQRYWRPRAMGSTVPEMIAALETHRHRGVDFVLITQNPSLVDQNVRRLVGRHIHVRRIFGMQRAVLYDWDGCQVDTSRVSGATKSYWSYPRDAYKLYTSSELHLKQKQKIPAWTILPVLAIVGGVFIMPKAIQAMSGAVTGKGITQQAQAKPDDKAKLQQQPDKAGQGAEKIAHAPTEKPQDQEKPAAMGPPAPDRKDPETEVAGCYIAPGSNDCKCVNARGRKVPQDLDLCPDPGPKKGDPKFTAEPLMTSQYAQVTAQQMTQDGEALAAMRQGKRSW